MSANVPEGDMSERMGWLLVGALLVFLVGFPVAILFWPPTFVPYRDAFLGLAMVPAVGLGLVGVYTAIRSRR